MFRVLISIVFCAMPLGIFQAWVDPYALLRPELEGKSIPYNTYYNYNLIRHRKAIDVGFLGSSAVNYFEHDRYSSTKLETYSMGLEGSNILEHTSYGRVLADAGAKEVVFFITFYALNPDRAPRPYFNKTICTLNFLPIDFIHQYGNWTAFKESLLYLKRKSLGQKITQDFRLDGSRTQQNYLKQSEFAFEPNLAKYIAWLQFDSEYYGSANFCIPSSIDPGIDQIKEYLAFLERNGVRWRIVTAPLHRMAITLIYAQGLGSTFEYHREALADIGPYIDLNLDLEFCGSDVTFWDTHHVRDGARAIDNLQRSDLLVTRANVQVTAEKLRPSELEQSRLRALRNSYKETWRNMRKTLVQ